MFIKATLTKLALFVPVLAVGLAAPAVACTVIGIQDPNDAFISFGQLSNPTRWSLTPNMCLLNTKSSLMPDFIFQSDGNLVVYRSGKAVWAANTNNKDAKVFDLQEDGNMVVYNAQGKALWASNTSSANNLNMALDVQANGDVVLWALRTTWEIIWATGTAAPGCGAGGPC